MLILTYNLHI